MEPNIREEAYKTHHMRYKTYNWYHIADANFFPNLDMVEQSGNSIQFPIRSFLLLVARKSLRDFFSHLESI